LILSRKPKPNKKKRETNPGRRGCKGRYEENVKKPYGKGEQRGE